MRTVHDIALKHFLHGDPTKPLSDYVENKPSEIERLKEENAKLQRKLNQLHEAYHIDISVANKVIYGLIAEKEDDE